ncbi:MAG TPA: ABC transporter ATP-binding protein [Pseudolysinimonas sp.]|nr:ABC transporter ATP-binding protein [Pseudolysinimonas sp.]
MLRSSSWTQLGEDGSAGPTRPADPFLSVRNITVRYGTAITALTDVSVDVSPGSITAVLGGNGAGKSTLMRAISGNLSRHSGAILGGDILLEGESLLGVSPERRAKAGVVQVPEGRRIFGRLTVTENLRVGRFGNPAGRTANDLERIFTLFPALAGKRRQRGALLSGGEQQMLAIGRALMAEPRVLLLDEPTLGLAPLIIDQIADLLDRIRSEGTTILLVEQNVGVALDLADTAYVFSTGTVALSGTAAELRNDDRVRSLYLGGEGVPKDTK